MVITSYPCLPGFTRSYHVRKGPGNDCIARDCRSFKALQGTSWRDVAWRGMALNGEARHCQVVRACRAESGLLSTGVELRALISDFMAFRSEGVRKERAG